MYPFGSKLQYVYELLCSIPQGTAISVSFSGGLSLCMTEGKDENCRVVDIPEMFRMTHGMFRSYATRIANEQGMVIKTKTTRECSTMFIWRVM